MEVRSCFIILVNNKSLRNCGPYTQETLSFCPKCVDCSKMMAISLSVRGHAAQRTLETMRAEYQHYVLAKEMHRSFITASHHLFVTSPFHKYIHVHVYPILST